MDTLADPLAFAGILGHLHVDLQKQKWDPGALDWRRLLRALNGFELPVQIRSFTEMPRTQAELVSARRAAFFNAEERATGLLPGGAGAPLALGRPPPRGAGRAGARADARARSSPRGAAPPGTRRRRSCSSATTSTSTTSRSPSIRCSPTWHCPRRRSDARPTPSPGCRRSRTGRRASRAALEAGEVVALDERVEAGDPVGTVGTVSRGPEQGPEVHFEIFTTETLAGELGRAFHYVNAADDGAIARRADLISGGRRATAISSSTPTSCSRSFAPATSIGGRRCGAWRSATATSGATERPRPSSSACASWPGSPRPSAGACTNRRSPPTSSGPTSCRARPGCPRTRRSTRTTR